MKIIREIICPHCGKAQVSGAEALWQEDLFWQPCEFCKRYGLYRAVRQKLTSFREWLLALFFLCENRRFIGSYSVKKEEETRPPLSGQPPV
jgi:hypothetical protein